VATNAPLEKVTKIFPGSEVIGASFGVALVKSMGMEIQVARFRTDGDYSDSRHPDSVVFVNDVMEDLKRRDFTINAMAFGGYSIDDIKLVYVDNSLYDFKNNLIRTVGNPSDRFKEDALRMMRAIRFACQLSFHLEESTSLSIINHAEDIKNISDERKRDELDKILMTQPYLGMNLLYEHGLLQYIIPELIPCFGCTQNKFHIHDVYNHIMTTVLFANDNLNDKLIALFHDIGKPLSMTVDAQGVRHFYGNEFIPPHQTMSSTIARTRLTTLKYDTNTVDDVCYMIEEHMFTLDLNLSKRAIRKLIHKHGIDRLKRLAEFKRADIIASGKASVAKTYELVNKFLRKIDEVLEEKPPTCFNDLAISGEDIMRVTGLKPSKKVGEIKNNIMNLVIDFPEMNNKETLLNYLEGIKKELG
jgi:tRNA nucleotidyltransferase/poly(A) polymerase